MGLRNHLKHAERLTSYNSVRKLSALNSARSGMKPNVDGMAIYTQLMSVRCTFQIFHTVSPCVFGGHCVDASPL